MVKGMATGTDPLAHGLALQGRHRWAQAVVELQRAAEFMPDNPLTWYWLAVTLDSRGQETEAIPAYRRALGSGLPQEWEANAWAWLGSSLRKTGRPEEALVCFATAEQLGYIPQQQLDQFRHLARRALKQAGTLPR